MATELGVDAEPVVLKKVFRPTNSAAQSVRSSREKSLSPKKADGLELAKNDSTAANLMKKLESGTQAKFVDEFVQIKEICDNNKRYKKYSEAAHDAKDKSI